jgi:hypothetical protein
MKTVWTAHLKDPKEREEFKQILKNSRTALDKLKKIVYTIREDRDSVTQRDYDNPSWAYKQAHNNGAIEMCDLLIDLLTLEKEPK